MNYFEFAARFPTEQDVINHFIDIRYKSVIPTCSKCHDNKRIVTEKNRPKFFHCNHCNKSFSIFKGTIFEKSDTDLRKWFYAIHLFLNGKKGISGYQLMREVGVTYKTAWRMLKQIRIAMGNIENPQFTDTIIEIDETYVGGKPRKGNKKKDDQKNEKAGPKRGRGTKKTPVIGIVDRTSKKVFAQVALPNKLGKKLTGKQLLDVLHKVSCGKNTIMTDEFRSYGILKTTEHVHLKIDHSLMYCDGDVHTNNIENFWGNVKRGILGIYHHVSEKHLQSYINEFSFRYNNRSNASMFDTLIKQSITG